MATGDPGAAGFSLLPNGSDAITPSAWRDAVALLAGVAQTVTVPTSGSAGRATTVHFSPAAGVDFYVAWRKTGDATPPTAVVPTATTTDGSAPEHNPVARVLGAMDAFSIVSASNCTINLSYFWL